tara:strand:- start:24532 stop:25317 length:786 start_codon:yes stop_codon:yes gene_type:complete
LPTLRLTQNDGEMLKPRELIEVHGAESLTLTDRRVYNRLIRNAHGPALGMAGSQFEMRLADLRMNHRSNDRLGETLRRLMRTLVVIKHKDGSTSQVALLGPNNFDSPRRVEGRLVYEIWPRLAEVLNESMVFAKLQTEVMDSFNSSYAYALYEAVALRSRLIHMRSERIDLKALRSQFLGVGENKLKTFGALRQTALDPALKEINELAPFHVEFNPIRSGRKIVGVHLFWRDKTTAELKQQYEAIKRRAGAQRTMFEVLDC